MLADVMDGIRANTEFAWEDSKEWQRNLKKGDIVVQAQDDGDGSWVNYIRVTTPKSVGMNKAVIVGEIHNSLYPDDSELESVYRNTLHGKLTEEEFERCKSAGWPNTVVEMLTALHSDGDSPIFAWVYTEDGKPAKSGDGDHLVAIYYPSKKEGRLAVLDTALVDLPMKDWVVVNGRYRWKTEVVKGGQI